MNCENTGIRSTAGYILANDLILTNMAAHYFDVQFEKHIGVRVRANSEVSSSLNPAHSSDYQPLLRFSVNLLCRGVAYST